MWEAYSSWTLTYHCHPVQRIQVGKFLLIKESKSFICFTKVLYRHLYTYIYFNKEICDFVDILAVYCIMLCVS
jgi:hypothetical protein